MAIIALEKLRKIQKTSDPTKATGDFLSIAFHRALCNQLAGIQAVINDIFDQAILLENQKVARFAKNHRQGKRQGNGMQVVPRGSIDNQSLSTTSIKRKKS